MTHLNCSRSSENQFVVFKAIKCLFQFRCRDSRHISNMFKQRQLQNDNLDIFGDAENFQRSCWHCVNVNRRRCCKPTFVVHRWQVLAEPMFFQKKNLFFILLPLCTFFPARKSVDVFHRLLRWLVTISAVMFALHFAF